MCDVSPIVTSTRNPNSIDYNVLAYLRKFLAKVSICDALILSKEMRDPLI